MIGGRYEGDTGLIVRVQENMVVLFSDLTVHEVIEGNLRKTVEDGDSNVGKTIKLITQDKKHT